MTVHIAGKNFTPPDLEHAGSTFAVWSYKGGETDLDTQFVSATEVTAIIPVGLLETAATAAISVVNGDVMGWDDGVRYPQSNTLTFTVLPASFPFISAISPSSAAAGSPALTIRITGTNFIGPPGINHKISTAIWSTNGTDTYLETMFVSATELTAVIPATLLHDAMTASISILDQDPLSDYGYPQSNAVKFTVVGSGSALGAYGTTPP
ncbi:MAG TPA: IPT/TIG domain-containing protein [Vicinamibacterales bacterium]|nr:IPT/TIG domain-containing protein [Vicinamibacterales bacterium]